MSNSSVSSGGSDICLTCEPAAVETGTSPYPGTQIHSVLSSRHSSATPVPTGAAQVIPQTDDDTSLVPSPESTDSGTSSSPTSQQDIDHSILGSLQVLTTAAPTAAAQTVPQNVDDDVFLMCEPAAVETGTSPYPGTQIHSVHSSHNSSATPVPTGAAQVIPQTDDDTSPLCSPETTDNGTSSSPTSQQDIDHSVLSSFQVLTTAVPTAAAQTVPQNVDDDVSLLCEPAAVETGTSPYPGTQIHSVHSSHHSSATPVPTGAAQVIPQTDDDISLVLSLSPDEKGRRLIEAAKEGAMGEMEELLAAGADVGARDKNERTALHLAAKEGHVEAVRQLLAAGPDVEARDEDRRTALHWAAKGGHVEEVRLLLAAGADVEARDWVKWTALHFAANWGHVEAVRLLLAAGADVEARDCDQLTALHLAAEEGHVEAARRLLAAGADVEARAMWLNTPLHSAASGGNPAMVRLLLEAGADHNARDNVRFTPLHSAVLRENTQVVHVLLRVGADESAVNSFGQTPLQLAMFHKKQKMVDLLLGSGEDEAEER